MENNDGSLRDRDIGSPLNILPRENVSAAAATSPNVNGEN